MSGPEMPRPGQVIIRYAHRGRVSIPEYPGTEVVGVRGGDALNLGDGHRSILMGRPPTQRTSYDGRRSSRAAQGEWRA